MTRAGDTITHGPPPATVTAVRALETLAVPAATRGKPSSFKMVVIVCVGLVLSALAAIFGINNIASLIPASNDTAVLQWGIGVTIMAFGVIATTVVAFLVNNADTASSNINVLNSNINVLRSDIFANFKDFKVEVKESVNEVKTSVIATNSRIDNTNSRIDNTNSRIDSTNSKIDSTNSRIDKLFELYSVLRADMTILERPN
jgi:methyl-accepting chemotaxis protein